MPTKTVSLRRWQIVLAFAAVAAGFVVGAWVFTGYNNDRIHDIQRDRLVSCQRTYEGVREVLRPFFRPANLQTKRERRQIRKFNRTVNRLKARCGLQTGVKGAP